MALGVYITALITLWSFQACAWSSLALESPQSQVNGGTSLSELLTRRSRSLQKHTGAQYGLDETLFIVNSAAEFRAALQSGAVHIEVQTHLDLTGLAWRPDHISSRHAPFIIPSRVLSIRGNCADAPFEDSTFRSSAGLTPQDLPLEPQKPGQCVIILDSSPRGTRNSEMEFWADECGRGGDTEGIWLDALYFKVKSKSRPAVALSMSRDFWMTNVTLQGSSEAGLGALQTSSEALFIDTTVADWSSNNRTVMLSSPNAPSASYLRTVFLRNTVMPSSALIGTDHAYTALRLEATTFEGGGNSAAYLVRQLNGAGCCEEGAAASTMPPSGGENLGMSRNSRKADRKYVCYSLEDEMWSYNGKMDPSSRWGEEVYSDETIEVARVCPEHVDSLPLAQARSWHFLAEEDGNFQFVRRMARNAFPTEPKVVVLSRPYRFTPDCAKLEEEEWPRYEPIFPSLGIEGFVVTLGIIVFCCLPCCAVLRRRSLMNIQQNMHRPPRSGRDSAGGAAAQDTGPIFKVIEAPKELYRVALHRWTTAPKQLSEHVAKLPADADGQLEAAEGVDVRVDCDMLTLQSENGGGDMPVYVPSAPAALEAVAPFPCSSHSSPLAGGNGVSDCSHPHSHPHSHSATACSCGGHHGSCGTAPTVTTDTACCSEFPHPSHPEGSEDGTPIDHESMHGGCDGDADLVRVSGSSMGIQDTACVICFEGTGDHVMFPCGHGGYCRECAQKMLSGKKRLCPICRAPVEAVVKVSLETPIGERADASQTHLLMLEPEPSKGDAGAQA